MRRILLAVLALFVAVSVAGCAKQGGRPDSLAMSSGAVKSAVAGWKVYTNPASRYELRFPKSWTVEDSGEDGVTVRFFQDKKVGVAVKITTFSNWQEKLDLAGFYARQSVDLLKSDTAREDVELDGQKAVWFKDVKGRVSGLPAQAGDANRLIDVVAVNLDSRILEIEVLDGWDSAKVILNSLNFYPDKVISDLK